MSKRPNLAGCSAQQIRDLMADLVDRPFRAEQIAQWVVRRHAASFDEMTNIPKLLREHLRPLFVIEEPAVDEVIESAQDGSRKYLFRLDDGVRIEGVAMRENTKATFCLSSQAGCAVGCTFCVTGALGAGRNLNAAEMVGQFRRMMRDVEGEVERANIVFMGMGEPLLNTGHLGGALEALYERVSPKRITVSTAGILPGIEWLAGLARRPKLAVSLNAADQATRVRLMPISIRYPLDELMKSLRAFPLERGRRITFEYVLLKNSNDGPDCPAALSRLLHGIPSKINLIPFNEDLVHLPGMHPPDEETIDRFARTLRDRGLNVTIRRSKGRDVAAACGQLKGMRS